MSSSPFNHHVETGLPLEQDVSLQQYMDAEKEKKRHRKKHGSSKSNKRHHHHKDVSSRVSEGTQKASNQSGDTHLPKHDTNKESSFAGNVPWLSPNEEMQSRRPTVMTKPLYANTSQCEDLGQRNPNTTVDTTMESETLPYTSTGDDEESQLYPGAYAVGGNDDGVSTITDDFPVESVQRNTPAQIPIENVTMLSAEMVDPDEDRRMLREELRNVLAEERERERVAVVPPIVSPMTVEVAPPSTTAGPQDLHNVDDRHRKRRCWMLLIGIVGVLALAGLAVGLVFAFVWNAPDAPTVPSSLSDPNELQPGQPTLPPAEPTQPSPSPFVLTLEPTTPPSPSFSSTPSPIVEPSESQTPAPVFTPSPTIAETPAPVTPVPTAPLPTIASPTIVPTPLPTIVPTQPPVFIPGDLLNLITAASFDGGNSVQTPGTPQYKALNWLAGNINLDTFSDERKIQRYSLATFYYSTSGQDWDPNSYWLADENECMWDSSMSCVDGMVTVFKRDGVLDGTLPNEIGLLSTLENLTLADNRLLTGLIPTAIGELSNLKDFDVSQSGFNGTIPTTFGQLTNLVRVSLSENSLTGPLPDSIVLLSNLVDASFRSNDITGQLPSNINLMTSLQVFDVYDNRISGPIPTGISQIPLTSIRLYDNELTGTIPVEITGMMQLKELRLDINQLVGTIPPGIGSLPNLRELRLYNNSLTGSFACSNYNISVCLVSCKTVADPTCGVL